MALEAKVRVIAQEILKGIQMTADNDCKSEWLDAAISLIVDSESERRLHPLLSCNYDDILTEQLKTVYREHHYSRLCNKILDCVTVEWMQTSAGALNRKVETIFLTGPATYALLALDKALSFNSKGFRLQKVTVLLEHFIKNDRLKQVLWEQCHMAHSSTIQTAADFHVGKAGLWDELVVIASSLPDKMANKLGREISDMFLPQNYVPLLGKYILECMHRCHDSLMKAHDCSLEFISRLLGKLCLKGYGDMLLDTVVPLLSILVSKDYVWCRICERVITKVPQMAMENVLVPLLLKIPWFGLVAKFLGDCVVENQRVQGLLCTKLLFHRFFSQVLLIQNLIGYLASSQTRRHLYFEVLYNLLKVWGNASTLRHVSEEQHLFLCRVMMVCISHLKDEDQKERKHELVRLLLPGVQAHLNSTDVSIRTRGMLVAQTLTRMIDPEGQQIEFEIVRSKEVEELEKLLVLPADPGLTQLERQTDSLTLLESHLAANSSDENNQAGVPKQAGQSEEDLDSDDDLVPYSMSNDKAVSKVKTPAYIRDCMEGLLKEKDPDLIEASLTAAEKLIRNRPDGLAEIAEEFTKILLHSTESHGIPDFVLHRFKAMVALTVHCPQQAAPYLTAQFYERNYSIRQRLDMLEVLAAAAQELSQPEVSSLKATSKESQKQHMCQTAMEVNSHEADAETWQQIVQKRINSKTRRFIKGPSRPEVTPVPNRFGHVAGEFFFPLMRFYDRSEPVFDLMGDDSLVLHRLVHTLAIILYAAINTNPAQQMGKSLLEFTWSLRMHNYVAIRQAVLVATSMIVLVVPGHFLLTDLQMDVMETREWLHMVMEKDVNTECRKLALQAITLLNNVIASELKSVS